MAVPTEDGWALLDLNVLAAAETSEESPSAYFGNVMKTVVDSGPGKPGDRGIPDENVVARLKRRLDDARGLGFRVRMEPLDGQQATWCVIAGVPTLFVDLSQTAAEQLHQVDESLAGYCQQRIDSSYQPSTQVTPTRSASNRAA